MIGRIFGNVLGALGKPIASAVGSWQARKQAEVEGRTEIEKARIDYKVAKYRAKVNRLYQEAEHAASYDMQVLRNRQHTWVDEFLVVAIVAITLCAFLPWTAPYVAAGWKAMAEAPFWFQFAWTVVIVSTLGGMMVLRIFMGSKTGNALTKKIQDRRSEDSR